MLSIFRQSSIAFLGFLFPILILKETSPTIWGEFFELFIFALVCSIISNWGNKDYLILKFSKEPNLIYTHFSENFIVRLPILFLCISIAFFAFKIELSLWLALWLMGRYMSWSFEVVNQYQKDNFITSIIEYSTFILLIILLKTTPNIQLNHLVTYYSIYQLIKGLAYTTIYFDWLKFENFKLEWIEIKHSFFYFLLAFSGFLASKIDVYVASVFFTSSELGQYGIQNNFFLFAMSIGNMILLPYIKILYRKSAGNYSKIKKRYAFFGLLITSASILIIYFLNTNYLNLYFEPLFYCLGFLYVLPSYLYGIDIYEKFKSKKEKHVLIIFTIGALFFFLSNLIMLNLNPNFSTLLISAAMSQWLIVILFKKDLFTVKN